LIKILTASVISFGLGAASMYFWGADVNPEMSNKTVQAPTEKKQTNHLQPTNVYTDYIRQLEELNRQLTKDLQAARGVQPTEDANKVVELPSAEVDHSKFEEYYQARKNSDDFSQYLQTVAAGNGVGYVKDLATKFETETVDSQWAAGYESKLYSLLESDALAGNIAAQSIVCKSRRCQIKVAISDIEQANQVMQSFSEAINNNQLAIDKSMVVSAPDVSEGVVNLYVARDASVKIHE
jgi:hypothetical protein